MMVTWRRLAELFDKAWVDRGDGLHMFQPNELGRLIQEEADTQDRLAAEAALRACDCHQIPHRLDCRSRK